MEGLICINAFIEKFCKQTIQSVSPFSSFYGEIISDSYQVQQEINEQFLSIASEKNIHYLNYIKGRLVVEILNEISIPTIDKWTGDTNLDISDFPFFDNEEIKSLLDIWIEQPYLDLEIENKAKEIQNDFYLFAMYLEVIKIIRLIDQLLIVPNGSNKTRLKTPQTFKLTGDTQRIIKDKAIDLYYSLLRNGYLVEDCKKDFVKLFTGQQPDEKIVWKGLKGELKSFIDLLIEENKIQDCKSSKWTITAANFKFKNQEFVSKTIKDTKKATNAKQLKYLVTRI